MAYLLSLHRPGVGGYHDHLAVYATLEAAQAYSTQIGGAGAWDTTVYDGLELWARDTTAPDTRHLIEWVNYYQAAADTDLEARVKALEKMARGVTPFGCFQAQNALPAAPDREG